MRPDWLASMMELRGMTVAVSVTCVRACVRASPYAPEPPKEGKVSSSKAAAAWRTPRTARQHAASWA